MCLQDIAISRSSTLKEYRLAFDPTGMKIPASPDRIALVVMISPAYQIEVYRQQSLIGAGWMLASNYTGTTGNTGANAYAVPITGDLTGALDTLVSTLSAAVPAGAGTVSIATNSPSIRMTLADYPGIISEELWVASLGGVDVQVIEVLLDTPASLAAQEVLA